MTRFLAAVCLASVLPLACGADEDEGVAELQGTWRAVSITVGGQSPTAHPENYAIIFKGDHFTFQDAGKVTGDGTYTVDASVMPKRIDLVRFDRGKPPRDPKRATLVGIYEVKKGTLKLCFVAQVNDKRPQAFAANKGSANELLICKKVNKAKR